MTWQTELQHIVFSKSFKKHILRGAGIALVLVCLFLLMILTLSGGSVGPLMLVPILYVSVGGAFGGAFYSLLDVVRNQGSWQKVLANVVGVLAYIVGLYICLILGLSVTGHWD